MKEKALGEALYKQSVKVLDALDGKVTSDQAVEDFNHQPAENVEGFKVRLNKMLTPKSAKVAVKKK